MKTTKQILSGIWWLGRGTATAMGVAVMLALTVGLASAALAAAPGSPFKLGQTNNVNDAFTRLVGSNGGDAMLKVDNDSAASGSRALDLRVEPGKAPLNVNADAGKATNLDADKVDGKGADQIGVNGIDFVFSNSVTDSESPKTATALCPDRTRLVGTGYSIFGGKSGVPPDQETDIVVDEVSAQSARVEVTAVEEEPTRIGWRVTATAICAIAP